MPVARADAVAAPAHRRLARDRAARRRRRRARALGRDEARSTTTTASTPAPPADCARRRARSASRPGLLIKALRGRRAGPLAKRVAGGRGEALRGRHRRRSRSDSAPPTCCTASSARRRCRARLDGLRKRVGRTLAQVVAGARAPGALRAAAAPRRTAPSASSTSRAAPRATWARSAATTAEMLPERGRAAVPARRFRRRLSGRRSTACAAGSRSRARGSSRRPTEVGRARSRAARRERGRPLADRVRHQPLRVPDEEAAGGIGCAIQDSIEFIHDTRAAARRRSTPERGAGRRPSGVQRAQDGQRRQAGGDRRPLQRRRGDGRRGAVLRLRRRRGLHPARAQRARACATCRPRFPPAAPAAYSSSRTCEIGLSEAGRRPVRVDPLPGRALLDRAGNRRGGRAQVPWPPRRAATTSAALTATRGCGKPPPLPARRARRRVWRGATGSDERRQGRLGALDESFHDGTEDPIEGRLGDPVDEACGGLIRRGRR